MNKSIWPRRFMEINGGISAWVFVWQSHTNHVKLDAQFAIFLACFIIVACHIVRCDPSENLRGKNQRRLCNIKYLQSSSLSTPVSSFVCEIGVKLELNLLAVMWKCFARKQKKQNKRIFCSMCLVAAGQRGHGLLIFFSANKVL